MVSCAERREVHLYDLLAFAGEDGADAGFELLGVDPAHIRVVVPLPKNREEMKAMLREEIAYDGVSVVIPRRECIQTAKRHNAAKQKQ